MYECTHAKIRLLTLPSADYCGQILDVGQRPSVPVHDTSTVQHIPHLSEVKIRVLYKAVFT